MDREGKIYLLAAALFSIVLACFFVDVPGAGWIVALAFANLPSLLIMASLSGRSRRRGLFLLGGLSLLLTAGLLTLIALGGAGRSVPLHAPLIVMLVGLWLIPWVWVTAGFVWMFDSFWPEDSEIDELKKRSRHSGNSGDDGS